MQKEQHILIVAGSLRFEGQGRANQDLIRSLHAQQGIQVSVVVSQAEDELPLPNDIPIYRVPDVYTVGSVWKLIQYIYVLKKVSTQVDVVHFATDFANFLLGALMISKPYIITAHGTYAVRGMTQEIKKKWLPTYIRTLKAQTIQRIFKKATYVHAVSSYTAERLQNIVPSLNPIVIPNAVSIDSFSKETKSPKEYTQYILSVGQVKPRKGIHIAIEAFATIANDFPHVEYVVVGDDSLTSYISDIQECIQKNHLEKRVHVLGRVSDEKLKQLFAHCMVYIQPSLTVDDVFEGYGIVFLEAGVYRKAVIGTRGSGIEDAIDDQKTGILVDQNNIEQTAQALRTLLEDKALRDRMGEANYQKSVEHDWNHVAKEFVSLYAKVYAS